MCLYLGRAEQDDDHSEATSRKECYLRNIQIIYINILLFKFFKK